MKAEVVRRQLLVAAGILVIALLGLVTFAVQRWQGMDSVFACNAPSMPWTWPDAKAEKSSVKLDEYLDQDSGKTIKNILLTAAPRTKQSPSGVATPKISLQCGPLASEDGDMGWTISVDWLLGFSIAGMKEVGEHEITLFADEDCNDSVDSDWLKTQLLRGDAAADWLEQAQNHDVILAEIRYRDGPTHYYRFDFKALSRERERIAACD